MSEGWRFLMIERLIEMDSKKPPRRAGLIKIEQARSALDGTVSICIFIAGGNKRGQGGETTGAAGSSSSRNGYGARARRNR